MSESTARGILRSASDRRTRPQRLNHLGPNFRVPPSTLAMIGEEADRPDQGPFGTGDSFCEEYWPEVSGRTFRRALHRAKLKVASAAQKPEISRANMQKRLRWARNTKPYINNDWKSVMFTDECTIMLNQRRNLRVLHRRGERFKRTKIVHVAHRPFCGCVNIWAGIGYNFRTPPIFLTGSGKRGAFKQADYRAQILPQLVGMMERFGRNTPYEPALMEDGNAAHGKRSRGNPCASFKRKMGWKLYWHPAQSPDLNPIEWMWRILKQRLRKIKVKSLAHLRMSIRRIWSQISKGKINRLILSMAKRREECEENCGDSTSF